MTIRKILSTTAIITCLLLSSCKQGNPFANILPNIEDANMQVVSLETGKKYIGFHDAPSHILSPDKRLPEKLRITYDKLPKGLLDLDWNFKVNGQSLYGLSAKDDELEVYLNGTDVSKHFNVAAQSAEANFNDLKKYIKQGKNVLSVEPTSRGPRIEFEADTQGPVFNVVRACKWGDNSCKFYDSDAAASPGYILVKVDDASAIDNGKSHYSFLPQSFWTLVPLWEASFARWWENNAQLDGVFTHNQELFSSVSDQGYYELTTDTYGGVVSKIEFTDEHGFKTIQYFDSRDTESRDMVKVKVKADNKFLEYINATLAAMLKNKNIFSKKYVEKWFQWEVDVNSRKRKFAENVLLHTGAFTVGGKDLSKDLTTDIFWGIHKKDKVPVFGSSDYAYGFSSMGIDENRWVDSGDFSPGVALWARLHRVGIGSMHLDKLEFVDSGDPAKAKIKFEVMTTDIHFAVETTSSCIHQSCNPTLPRPKQPDGASGGSAPSFMAGAYDAAKIVGTLVITSSETHDSTAVDAKFEEFYFVPTTALHNTGGTALGGVASAFASAVANTVAGVVPYILSNSLKDFDFDFNVSPKKDTDFRTHLMINKLATKTGLLEISARGFVDIVAAAQVNQSFLGSRYKFNKFQSPVEPTTSTPVTLKVDRNFINNIYHQIYLSGLTHLTVTASDKKVHLGPNAVTDSIGEDGDMKVELIPSSAGILEFNDSLGLDKGLQLSVSYTNAKMQISRKTDGQWSQLFLVDADMKADVIASIDNGDVMVVLQGLPEIRINNIENNVKLPFGIDNKVVEPLIKTFISVASSAMAYEGFEFKIPDVDEKSSVFYRFATTAVSTSTTVSKMELAGGNPQITFAFDASSNAKIPILHDGCANGWEKDGALCYPKCNRGYYGVGPVCWQHCPSHLTDTGVRCQDAVVIKAKDSYGRGVGVVPNACPSHKPQYEAGLCYKPCRSNWDGIGFLCYKKCPSDYSQNGLICGINHIYTQPRYERGPNGGINIWTGKCALPTEVRKGLLCYDKCPSGWDDDLLACTQRCKRWYVDTGLFCQRTHNYARESYNRGVGEAPSQCPRNKPEKDAGLCYPRCRSGFHGVGPVCWQSGCSKFGSDFTDDGATCRRDRSFTKNSYGRGAGEPVSIHLKYVDP